MVSRDSAEVKTSLKFDNSPYCYCALLGRNRLGELLPFVGPKAKVQNERPYCKMKKNDLGQYDQILRWGGIDDLKAGCLLTQVEINYKKGRTENDE